MIGQMASDIALLGFNDLGRSVTPAFFCFFVFLFFFQKQILFKIISPLSKNEQKINVGS